MGQLLNREALLKKQKFEIVKVELDNDDFVYVRQMSGHEREIFEQSIIRPTKNSEGKVVGYENVPDDFRAKLLVCTLCDEEGNPLLKPEDAPLLSRNMTAKTLEKIADKAQSLNKISEKDKEELEKNSDPGQADNSSSASAGN
jgi:hypothetical protein